MTDCVLAYSCAVFVLAGIVKGVIGLGLPTISMGLLSIVLPPPQAAAILVLPSFVTNVWQMLVGGTLTRVFRRQWTMLLGVCIGTWSGLGLMSGASARFGTACLGVALAFYALSGLAAVQLSVPKRWEALLAPLVGAMTGLITAGTGVFVIPAVPYLRAIGLENEELSQSLGLSFTVSTVALAANVAAEGGIRLPIATEAFATLGFACLGMWLGQLLRSRLSPSVFRRTFFAGLLILGFYLAIRPLL